MNEKNKYGDSKKKHMVCHLLYEEYPRDPRVRRYVNALNEAGIYCVIICSKKKRDSFYENLNGNPVYRIPVSKQRSSFIITFIEYLLFTSVSSVLLAYLGIKYRFRIIHVHTLPDFLIFAALWNKLFGAKLILDLHEIFPELYMARTGADRNSFKVRLIKLAEKLSIKLADKVITIHDNALDIFASRNSGISDKISVIMNSVDPAEFSNMTAEPAAEFTIIYNGSIVKLLNLTMTVKALSLLKKTMPPGDFAKIRYRLYGDGPDLKNILNLAKEEEISGSVEYMGYLQPAEMRKQVLKAGVLILPPLKNIYSDLFYTIKLIETIYLKIPVIATRLNTYKRYYREESIFYFDSGNIEQLADRISEVYYNKELVKQKTENARIDYDKLGWDIMKERYLRLIKKMIET